MVTPHQNHRSIEGVVEYVRSLPLPDQVELIRRIAPAILGALDDDDRNELVSDLNEEITRQALSSAIRR